MIHSRCYPRVKDHSSVETPTHANHVIDMALEQFKRENFQFDRDSDDDFLGAGSFGVVFKATIIGTGQVVALKILNTSARLQKRSAIHSTTDNKKVGARIHGFVTIL